MVILKDLGLDWYTQGTLEVGYKLDQEGLTIQQMDLSQSSNNIDMAVGWVGMNCIPGGSETNEVNSENELKPIKGADETRIYKPSPKHDPVSGWGSPDPYYYDIEAGQKALDTAYFSSKDKQLYNITSDGKLVKYQPDTNETWHCYEVENPSKEVPADVLRQMKADKKITNVQYNKFTKNKE